MPHVRYAYATGRRATAYPDIASDERRIPDFPRYAATTAGEIISYVRARRVLTRSPDRHGYPSVTLWHDGKRRLVGVHVLVLLAFTGPKPSPTHVGRHLNGDKLDNRPANLQWGTTRENAQDAVRHGTAAWLHQFGERGNSAKLTEAQVWEIEGRVRSGEHPRALGEEFGVCERQVRNIRDHQTWRHLWGDA